MELRRPTDEALRDALRLNDEHVRGLTRLDQELVYVPLAAVAAALFAAVAAPSRPHLEGGLIVFAALLIAGAVVLAGLERNHQRHKALYEYRKELVKLLELPALPERADLARGRQIYALLFGIAWLIESAMLTTLLSS